MKPDRPVADLILLSARSRWRVAEFTESDLIIACWQDDPDAFGLEGSERSHVDANKVRCVVMGAKGLVKGRRWLEQTGRRMYRLTDLGRQAAEGILNPQATPTEREKPTVSLPKDVQLALSNLLRSAAVEKFQLGRKAEVSFADACTFWGIADGMGAKVDRKLEAVTTTLAIVERYLADHDTRLVTGRVVTAGDVRALTNIHRWLADRFQRHLGLIRSRPARKAVTA